MDYYKNFKYKENSLERICKVYGVCSIEPNILDSTRITLYGLYCLNKHSSKAS